MLEQKHYINTQGLELRARDMVGAYAVQTPQLPPEKKSHAGFIKSAAHAFKTNKAVIYKTDADFIKACGQLCERMGQPELFPILSTAEASNPVTPSDIFEDIEEEGITQAQAAVLGIMLGYDPAKLEELERSSSKPLPFSIAAARLQWEQIVSEINPAAASRLKTPRLNDKGIDPYLVTALDPDHAPAITEDRGSFSNFRIPNEFDPQNTLISKARSVLKTLNAKTTEGIKGLIENEFRDRYVGGVGARLLQMLATHYRGNDEEYKRDLSITLSVVAGRNPDGSDYFTRDEIRNLLDTGTLDGENILSASDWMKRSKPLVRMLKFLLDQSETEKVAPFLRFMTGAEFGLEHTLIYKAGDALKTLNAKTTEGIKDIVEDDERDKYVGAAGARLLKTLAANYLSHNTGEEYKGDLSATLSAVAGKNADGADYFTQKQIRNLLDSGALDGEKVLSASDWMLRSKPLEQMLKFLLDQSEAAKVAPFLGFMTGATHLRTNAEENVIEADGAAKTRINPPYSSASESETRAEFRKMLQQQKAAIAVAEEKSKGLPPEKAAEIATDLFNELININITISGREPHKSSNLKIAELLAGQALGTNEAIARQPKFKRLVRLIEDIRHGEPFDQNYFHQFGSEILGKIVMRVLLRDIRPTHTAMVMELLTKNERRFSTIDWSMPIIDAVESTAVQNSEATSGIQTLPVSVPILQTHFSEMNGQPPDKQSGTLALLKPREESVSGGIPLTGPPDYEEQEAILPTRPMLNSDYASYEAYKQSLGFQIKLYRAEREMSLQDVADAIAVSLTEADSVSVQQVRKWEQARELPSEEQANALAIILIDENAAIQDKQQARLRFMQAYERSKVSFAEPDNSDNRYTFADMLCEYHEHSRDGSGMTLSLEGLAEKTNAHLKINMTAEEERLLASEPREFIAAIEAGAYHPSKGLVMALVQALDKAQIISAEDKQALYAAFEHYAPGVSALKVERFTQGRVNEVRVGI